MREVRDLFSLFWALLNKVTPGGVLSRSSRIHADPPPARPTPTPILSPPPPKLSTARSRPCPKNPPPSSSIFSRRRQRQSEAFNATSQVSLQPRSLLRRTRAIALDRTRTSRLHQGFTRPSLPLAPSQTPQPPRSPLPSRTYTTPRPARPPPIQIPSSPSVNPPSSSSALSQISNRASASLLLSHRQSQSHRTATMFRH